MFIILNIWTLKDGHNWGGDFSQYIIHARNILEHREYSFSYNLDRDIAYPPGLPLVLAPLINYFGIDFRVLKLPNIFFWLFYVLALYLLMKNRFDKESALLGALVFLFSPYFFWFKQNVISDIPFLFFATISL